MSRITRFEALAERLVEGAFARLFAGRLSPLEVATHLTRAMEDNQVIRPDGSSYAPTHYWVYLHSEDHAALAQEQPLLTGELAAHVIELAAQAGLTLKIHPTVHVLPKENIDIHQVHIEARWMPDETETIEKTHEMAASKEKEVEETTKAPPGRPFLILQGRHHVDLFQPVVSIGRALDNNVIIEDPRISRHHAQLRRRYGRYVLYDLGSFGGTQINNYPVEECVLHAGDVISLAGVQVIYSEDSATPIPQPTSEDTPALTREDRGNEQRQD